MKLNPKQVEKMMRRMGIQSQEIQAEEVIIKTPEKDIVISNPQVSKVNMMGQETFQIIGEISEKEKSKITEQDIEMVMNQAGVSREEAQEALEATQGDLAESILRLKKKK